jgi:hypothetical protein
MVYMPKRARYAVPVVIAAVIGGLALGPALSGASSPPSLPSQSAQQLLVAVAEAHVPALSGTLSWTADLGLSDLSTLESELGQGGGGGGGDSSAFDPLSLLSGTYDIDVWLGVHAEHLALSPVAGEEVDFFRNGDQVWLWDSSTSTATRIVGEGGDQGAATGSAGPAAAPLTPPQMASQLLSHLSPTTSVAVEGSVYVAGQPAYRLLVAPKDPNGSTIDHVEIDVGAAGSLIGVPLQVAVFSSGQAVPSLQLGFAGQIDLAAPAPSELTFTPPPGADVVTHDVGGLPSGRYRFGDLDLGSIGGGWTTVLTGTDARLATSAGQGELAGLSSVVEVGGAQARLFGTDLVNVLIMPDGQFYAGFVTAGVLEAAASTGA